MPTMAVLRKKPRLMAGRARTGGKSTAGKSWGGNGSEEVARLLRSLSSDEVGGQKWRFGGCFGDLCWRCSGNSWRQPTFPLP
jgi:hypothetical protein